MTRMPLSSATAEAGTAQFSNWWDQINDSQRWQDGIFFTLCAAYALVSAVALVIPSLSLLLQVSVLGVILDNVPKLLSACVFFFFFCLSGKKKKKNTKEKKKVLLRLIYYSLCL